MILRARSELQRRLLTEQRLQLEVRLRIAVRAERKRRARLRQLLRQLTYVEQREYERRGPRLFSGDGAVASSWHAVAPDGPCPAELPQWAWQLLPRAAEADDPVARADALAQLHAHARLALGAPGAPRPAEPPALAPSWRRGRGEGLAAQFGWKVPPKTSHASSDFERSDRTM